jgi:hypothetical protein
MVGPPSENRNCNAGNEASDRKAFLPNSIAIQKFIRVAISLAAGCDARNLDSRSANRAPEIHSPAAQVGRVTPCAPMSLGGARLLPSRLAGTLAPPDGAHGVTRPASFLLSPFAFPTSKTDFMKTTDHRHIKFHRLPLTLACCLGGILTFLQTASQAQETFKIDRISYAAGYVTLEFTDTRLNADPNLAYALDCSDALGKPASWTYAYALGTTFSPLGGDKRMVTLPASNTNCFYRIGIDTDRDGLSDGLEAAKLGTNPNNPDSDGDGYSDLIEIANGTSPTNALNKPLRTVQPSVRFAATTSQTIEGAGTIQIPVEFNTLYSGQLHYSVSAMSTATNGSDFSAPTSGTVIVNGTNAAIPIDIKDDLEVENIEAIVLELNDDAAGTYHVGAFPTHSLLLMDNDGNWSGILQSGVGESSFRLCVLHSNAQTTATLIPSSKSSTNHLGGQLIPMPPLGQSGWPVTNLTLTPTNFTGDSVALSAGASRLLGQVPLVRTFHFSAVPPPPGDTNTFYLSKTNATFGPLFIAGEYAEVLAPAQGGIGSQQFTNRGYFFLAREVPVMTPLTIPTTPVNP